jgi:hypothetical protein
MIRFKGQLRLKRNSDDYGVYTGETFEDLSGYLHNMVDEHIEVTIEKDSEVVYQNIGKLGIEKLGKGIYYFVIGNEEYMDSLDYSLRDNLDSNVNITINIKT